jgi:hypothetical protein
MIAGIWRGDPIDDCCPQTGMGADGIIESYLSANLSFGLMNGCIGTEVDLFILDLR